MQARRRARGQLAVRLALPGVSRLGPPGGKACRRDSSPSSWLQMPCAGQLRQRQDAERPGRPSRCMVPPHGSRAPQTHTHASTHTHAPTPRTSTHPSASCGRPRGARRRQRRHAGRRAPRQAACARSRRPRPAPRWRRLLPAERGARRWLPAQQAELGSELPACGSRPSGPAEPPLQPLPPPGLKQPGQPGQAHAQGRHAARRHAAATATAPAPAPLAPPTAPAPPPACRLAGPVQEEQGGGDNGGQDRKEARGKLSGRHRGPPCSLAEPQPCLDGEVHAARPEIAIQRVNRAVKPGPDARRGGGGGGGPTGGEVRSHPGGQADHAAPGR